MIVEITYTIYQGLSRSEEKTTTRQGFNFRRNFAFACFPSLSTRAKTWLEPTIQSKTYCLVSGQLQKTTRALNLRPRYGHVTLVSRYFALIAVN